ncbi:Mdm33 family-domain-containing protein [Cristinia sonorae]|uniref:Sensitive to high expression protein 9, mitochondrial n=1 Tax=Cristinia sonorae TaxID=1940300 RepID=A0A8K0UUC9_9AGAR|nr:Mdm33 family-domain-containing protein [Cristinia sonorae]
MLHSFSRAHHRLRPPRPSATLRRHLSSLPPPPPPKQPNANSSELSPELTESSASAKERRIEEFKQILKDWTERTSTVIRRRADDYTARAASTFAQLGSELNKVTGYGEIDLLKKRVVAQERLIDAARQEAREAKAEYDKAVLQRANSQREVNDLLQRKSNWTDEDVSRFTSLVRQDHLFEQNEARAKAHAALTEGKVEREFSELMRVILNRYHEEQIWSDKIRSASTYGSLTVLGLNLLVFIMAILFVEPWKRKRLAQTFEKKVDEMTEATTAAYDARAKELVARMDKQDEALFGMAQTLNHFVAPPLPLEEAFPPPPPADLEDDTPAPPSILPDGTVVESQPGPWLSTLYGADAPLLVLTTSVTAAALGWLARSWFGP